jgi:ribosome-binding protein aMBF1 (putative translation factor)
MHVMTDFANRCFVCGTEIDPAVAHKNKQVNLPVCRECEGTDRETEVVAELLEGMAEGFVCGCI